MKWDKPEGAEDWLAAVLVILLVTAAIALPIVGGVMYLLLDAPTWILTLSTVVILAAVTWPVFSPERADAPDEVETRWVRVRPEGAAGWVKFIFVTLGTWVALSILINKLILDVVFGVDEQSRHIVALVLLPLAIAFEMFDAVDDEPSSQR